MWDSDAYILVTETVAVPNTEAGGTANNRTKNAIFRKWSPFTDCTSEINIIEVDHANDIDVVMPMHNLIEYSDNYSKTSGSVWL